MRISRELSFPINYIMTLGIVGSEQAKFTPETERAARLLVQELIIKHAATKVVSGGCHLGGVDIYAREESDRMNVEFEEFLPAFHRWEGGYKQRNMKIAQVSDFVVCITVRDLPPTYRGMRFERGGKSVCYHCKTIGDHVKSGGCWTVKYAKSLGKQTAVLVV